MIIKEGALSRFSSTVVGLTVWYKSGRKAKGVLSARSSSDHVPVSILYKIFSLESVKYFLYCIYRNVLFNMSRFFCLGAKLNRVVGNNSSPAICKSSSGTMNVSQCGMDGDFQNIPAQIFPDSCS